MQTTLNQGKALVGAFSIITNLRVDLRFKLYLAPAHPAAQLDPGAGRRHGHARVRPVLQRAAHRRHLRLAQLRAGADLGREPGPELAHLQPIRGEYSPGLRQ